MSRTNWQIPSEELKGYKNFEEWNEKNKPFKLMKCIVVSCQRYWRVLPKNYSGIEYTKAQMNTSRLSYTIHCKKHAAVEAAMLLDESFSDIDMLAVKQEEEEKKQKEVTTEPNDMDDQQMAIDSIPSTTEEERFATIVEDFNKLRGEDLKQSFYFPWETLEEILNRSMSMYILDKPSYRVIEYENHKVHLNDRHMIRCRDLVAVEPSPQSADFKDIDILDFKIARTVDDQMHLYLYINADGLTEWMRKSNLSRKYYAWLYQIREQLLKGPNRYMKPGLLDSR